MACTFQTPRPALKTVFNKSLYKIRTTTRHSIGFLPFEAHFGRKLNTIWHTVAKTSSAKKLSWKKIVMFLR